MDTASLAKLIFLFLAVTILGTTLNSCSNKNAKSSYHDNVISYASITVSSPELILHQ